MTLLDDIQEARKKFQEDHCCTPNFIFMSRDFHRDLMRECYYPTMKNEVITEIFGMEIKIDKDSMEPFYLEEYEHE